MTTLALHDSMTASTESAEYEPELPSQINLPEGWEQPAEEKTAVQKFLYPDEDELTSDFAVSQACHKPAA